MHKQILIISFLIFLSSSCSSEKKSEVKQNFVLNNDSVVESFIQINFDWKGTTRLKNKTIEELKKKTKSNDKIIMRFIDNYAKIVDELNDSLIKHVYYDSLCTLYYTEQKSVKQNMLVDFTSLVEANGLRIASSEGTIYISQNTDYIRSEIIPLLDAISVEFLNLYCLEFDNICCDDAGVIISIDVLINRIDKWGELSKNVANLEYEKYVEDEYYSNLSLLFCGLDNTPSFDWDTHEFNKEILDSMTRFIEDHPNSRTTIDFKQFIELLNKENYKQTKNIDVYFKKKFNYAC